jgi:hypothetical protein
MQIPNNFKLYSQTWTIRTGNEKEMNDNLGLCFGDSNEILLNPSQTSENLIHTLLHEILHSIEQKQHLEMTERQIDCLALGLLHLFSENPEMISLLESQE